MKKFFVVLVTIIMLSSTTLSYAQENYGAQEIKLNEIKIKSDYLSITPEINMYNINTYNIKSASSDMVPEAEQSFPDYYRSPYVSPVKAQGDSGNCWIFSILGAAEGYMLKHYPIYDDNGNLKTDAYDFSENHMQYMVSNKYNNDKFGNNMELGTAGHAGKSIPYFLNRRGPVDDYNDEFIWPAKGRDYSETANIPLSDYVVTGMTRIEGLTYEDAIDYNSEKKQAMLKMNKKLIMDYGSVVCTVLADKFVGANLYYMPASEQQAFPINHAVLVVGWDDNYPKEKFKRTVDGVDIMPQGNGAFIIKNSWGTNSLDSGYFYLSYYDYYAGHDLTAVTGMKPRDNSEILYSYDDFFPYYYLGFNLGQVKVSALMFGNQFEKKTKDETLTEVSFYATEGSEYDIYIINDEMKEGYIKETEERVVYFPNMTTKTKKVYDGFIPECEGYYTVDVDDTKITSDKFSVMIVGGNLNGDYQYLHIESNSPQMQVTNAKHDDMQSFFFYYLTDYPQYMYDYYDKFDIHGNAPVKAITRTEEKYTDISFVNFTNEDKEEEKNYHEGDTVRIAAVVDGVNLDEETRLICGIYNGNKLVKVLDNPMGNKGNVFNYENIPADFGNYSVKVFAIDSYNNLKPLGNAFLKEETE